MNRRKLIAAAAAAVALALPSIQSGFAQQSEAPAAAPHTMPSVDDHLRMLTQKLDLTDDQQDKARPIIAEMQDAMQKVNDDKSLTHDEAMAKTHAAFMKADKQFREFLTEKQKAKLDEMEQQMHPGHGAS